MIFDFRLQILSPEFAYALLAALVFFVLVLLFVNRHPNETHNTIKIKGSKGSNVNIDQSKHVDVTVKAKVNITPPARPEPPRRTTPSSSRSGNIDQNDAVPFLMAIGLAFVFAGYYYLHHFELITIITRTLSFTAVVYGVLGYVLDTHWRGWQFDEIKAGYLLACVASLFAAAFLLQAQALISSDVVQAAALPGQKATDFIFNRLTHTGRIYLAASLITSVSASFVAVMSLLSILRALLLFWSDEEDRSFLPRLILSATDWVAPIPFLIMAVTIFVGLGLIFYSWLPNVLPSFGAS